MNSTKKNTVGVVFCAQLLITNFVSTDMFLMIEESFRMEPFRRMFKTYGINLYGSGSTGAIDENIRAELRKVVSIK